MPVDESGMGRLRLEAPMPDALLPSRMVMVRGTADVAATEVVINGSTHVPIVDGAFSTTIMAEEGDGRIEVTVADLKVRSQFEVDSLPPVIHLTEPGPGVFVNGESLKIAGRVEEANLTELYLDDQRVDVGANGAFSVTRRVAAGAQRVRIRAKDRLDREAYTYAAAIVGPMQSADQYLQSGLVVTAGQTALDQIAVGVRAGVATYDISSTIVARNPAQTAWWGDVNATGEHHDDVEVTIDASSGSLIATLSLVNPHLDFVIDTSVGDYDMTSTAERVTLRGELVPTVTDGVISAQLMNPTVSFYGFNNDIHSLEYLLWALGGISGGFSVEAIETNVQEKIRASTLQAVNEILPTWVNQVLSELALETTYDALGATANVSARPRAVQLTRENGLRILLDTHIEPQDPKRMIPGYLSADRSVVPAPSGDLDMCVSIDMLNAALFTAWSAGILDYSYEGPPFQGHPLTVGALSAFVPSIRTLAPMEAVIVLDVDATLPAAVRPGDGDEGQLVLEAPDVELVASAMVDGHKVKLFSLSLAGEAAVNLVVREGKLVLDLARVTMIADPKDAPGDTPVGATLDELIRPFVMEPVMRLFALPQLPLPALYGYRLDSPMPTVDGRYIRVSSPISYSME